jgi:hypothetical protein
MEGRRLVRHPLFVGGVLASVGGFVLLFAVHLAPVLQRDDIWTGLELFPLAVATFLLTNLAALRSRRHGTDELLETTPTSISARTLGHVLSVGWAVAVSTLVLAGEVAYTLSQRPVGSPNLLELAVGPAIVAVLGVLGVALARWWRSAAGGPVSLVALGGIEIYLMFQLPNHSSTSGQYARWLALWVPMSTAGDPARELVIRPSAWHLLYLVGLAGVIAVVALLRHGLSVRSLGLGTVALALAVVAGTTQVRPPTSTQRNRLAMLVLHPARYQVCRTDLGVRYCAYPGYKGWLDRWQQTGSSVVKQIPARGRRSDLIVRQALTTYGGDVPLASEGRVAGAPSQSPGWEIPVPDRWGATGVEGEYELSLALGVAGRTLGLSSPIVLRTKDEIQSAALTLPKATRADFLASTSPGIALYCSADGQSRAVVALWLAAQSTSKAQATFLHMLESEPLGVFERPPGFNGWSQRVGVRDGQVFLYRGSLVEWLNAVQYLVGGGYPVLWGNADVRYAAQLLHRPKAEVAAAITANWDLLTRRSTSTAQLVRVLGLQPLPTLAEQLRHDGLDPKLARRLGPVVSYEAIPCP